MLGDTLYAPPEVLALSPRLLLHARYLALTHPFTGQALTFDATPTWSAKPPFQLSGPQDHD